MKSSTMTTWQTVRGRSMIAAAMLTVIAVGTAQAIDVTTWRTFRGTDSTATVVDSGQGTNDPVIGNTTTTASATRIVGYFAPQTLTNTGDKISLTYTVSFNDAVGMASNSGDNWRYALYDLNGETAPAAENTASNGSSDTNNFLGYWAGVKTGAGAGAAGSLRERFDVSNNDLFANASATANLVTPPIDGTNVLFSGLVNGEGTPTLYTGEFTITKTATGIDLSGKFSGNGGENTFAFSEATPISLTYGAVGFLNGGGMNADQVILQDVVVAFTPAGGNLIPGDFNNDQNVNDVDFGIWKNDFGTTKDGEDFLDWQAYFGTGTQAAAAMQGVPEPGTAGLAALGMAGLVRRRRRRGAAAA